MTIEWLDIGRGVIGLLAFAAVIAVAVVIIRSAVKNQNQEELEALAETRGNTIKDLREKVDRLEVLLVKMEARVEYLEQREKQDIIDGVIQGVVEGLK